MSVNNVSIYTPFFLNPKPNRIIARRRPNTAVPTTYHLEDNDKKAKTRRPNPANGNGECLYIPVEGINTLSNSQQSHHPYFVRRIQPRDMLESSVALQTRSKRQRTNPDHHSLSQQQKCHALQDQQQVVDDESGLQGVAAEVEVNVEDDPIDSPPVMKMCFDVNELRSRLSAAYHKIEQLEHTNVNYQRCKQENYYLKNELAKSENRSIQIEAVVLEKNMRLKQLLRENIAQSARLKRIQSEFGVDAVKEIFSNQEKL
uniref:Uncharacterized protein n=1 Tax=Ditylenchus dipsaci TaxID=166011 RepID=A0A915ER91_9BILA